MYRFIFGPLGGALVLSLALAGCGDDGPTASGDDLSEQEVQAMTEALVAAGGWGFGVIGGSTAPAADGIAAIEIQFEESFPCPNGGSVQVSGTIDVDEAGETFDWSMTRAHDSCTATASSDGSQWTFDGSPSITSQFAGSANEQQFSIQGTETGGISWTSGGRSGTCNISVSYSFSGSETTFNGTLSGTVCGHDVSQSVQVNT